LLQITLAYKQIFFNVCILFYQKSKSQMKMLFTIAIIASIIISCNSADDNTQIETKTEIKQDTVIKDKPREKELFDRSKKTHTINVIRKIPHSKQSFTQGLLYHNGFLYESTGQLGQSAVYKIDPSNGDVLVKTSIDRSYFGEGIALLNNKIYMLTWRSRTCLIFDINSLMLEKSVSYQGEGWGITTVEGQLVMSDGSNVLKYLDDETLEIRNKVFVSENGKDLKKLNELEYIGGEIWSNIWMEATIARIDPRTGVVNGIIDVSPLYYEVEMTHEMESINGIAYDMENGKIYLTGKNWPYIFEVEIVETEN
jgi:glutamine cyclotransferase